MPHLPEQILNSTFPDNRELVREYFSSEDFLLNKTGKDPLMMGIFSAAAEKNIFFAASNLSGLSPTIRRVLAERIIKEYPGLNLEEGLDKSSKDYSFLVLQRFSFERPRLASKVLKDVAEEKLKFLSEANGEEKLIEFINSGTPGNWEDNWIVFNAVGAFNIDFPRNIARYIENPEVNEALFEELKKIFKLSGDFDGYPTHLEAAIHEMFPYECDGPRALFLNQIFERIQKNPHLTAQDIINWNLEENWKVFNNYFETAKTFVLEAKDTRTVIDHLYNTHDTAFVAMNLSTTSVVKKEIKTIEMGPPTFSRLREMMKKIHTNPKFIFKIIIVIVLILAVLAAIGLAIYSTTKKN